NQNRDLDRTPTHPSHGRRHPWLWSQEDTAGWVRRGGCFATVAVLLRRCGLRRENNGRREEVVQVTRIFEYADIQHECADDVRYREVGAPSPETAAPRPGRSFSDPSGSR